MADTTWQIECEDWIRREWMPEQFGEAFPESTSAYRQAACSTLMLSTATELSSELFRRVVPEPRRGIGQRLRATRPMNASWLGRAYPRDRMATAPASCQPLPIVSAWAPPKEGRAHPSATS